MTEHSGLETEERPVAKGDAAEGGGNSLDGALARAIAWSGGVKLLTQIVAWTSTLVVARLLSPEDYGLIGMAAVYLYLVQLLSELGIGTAVITLRALTRHQLEQINTLSVLAGLFGFMISVAAARPLGRFFESPHLPAVVLVMSTTFIINSFRVVPSALLQRSLNFRRLALIDGAQAIGLAAVNVALAMAGFRYWTLVIGSIMSAILSTTLIVRARPCRFAPIEWRSIAHALTFSWRVVIGTVSWYVYTDADFLIAGKRLGAAALGAYNFGWTLANVPIEKITSLVNSVTPSFFSAAQHDRVLTRRYLLLITEGIALATFPATLGLALVADDLVLAGLGEKWRAAIVPLRLLALYSSVRSIMPFLVQVLNVTGSTRYVMWVNIIAAILLPLGFYFGSHWGSSGIALAWIAVHPIVVAIPIAARVFSSLSLPVRGYFRALWPATASCIGMAAAVLSVRAITGESLPRIATLVILVLVGAIAYVGVLNLFFRSRVVAIRQGWALIRSGQPAVASVATPTSATSMSVPANGRITPYFSTHSASTTTGPRVLLVAYNFPPDETIGALRWQKMARRFCERGWQMDVIALDPSCIPRTDAKRYADLPSGLRAFGVPLPTLFLQRLESIAWRCYRMIIEPERSADDDNGSDLRPRRELTSRLRLALRAHRARIDYAQMARWANEAARRGIQIVEPGVHCAVITTGPPHLAHEAGRIIATRTGLPLVVDLRDAWSLQTVERGLPEYLASPTWIELAQRYEKPIIESAAVVALNTQVFERAMAQVYPHAAGRFVTVMNGSDDDVIPPSRHDSVFRLRFAGSIYDVSAPGILLEAASRVIERLGLTPEQFSIEFLMDQGHYEGVPVDVVARRAGVEAYLTIHPLRPRAEALEFLAGATMLVSLRQYSPLAIPAKLFEYVRVAAWLLVMAEKDSATEVMLRGTGAEIVEPGDVEETAAAIQRCYEAFRAGERPQPVAAERDFSRRAQADVLIDRIEAVLNGHRSA